MDCPINETRYVHDIFTKFFTRCNQEIYFDEDFPVAIHYYMDDQDTAKIFVKLQYDPNNSYVLEKLSIIKSSLEKITSEFDIELSDIKKDYAIPKHKLGGRNKEKQIINNIIEGKECLKYTFIIKPDYLSEKYTN